ncbi:MAG: hypothetical protein IJW59_01875 [Clostridia bacterium]|nr:hypothetical protein [Clostridia bacterium]
MTNIYKTISLDNSFENIICLAEESYFVEIIVEYEQCYRVNYNQVTGFVKKADVKEISNTPLTPYPNNIKLTIGNNCNLRSSPTTQSTTTNIVIPIYTNTENIEFIGRIFGEEAIDFGGNTWYLIKHNNQYGYIYNKYVSSISPIYYNTENVSYTQEDIQSIQNPITHTPSIILIIILSIPIAITLFIFFLPQKTKHKPKRTPKIIEKY